MVSDEALRWLVDPIHLGEVVDVFKVEPGMEVLWCIVNRNRYRAPYDRGDVLEATIKEYPWRNGKIKIITKNGIHGRVVSKSLFLDKRKSYEVRNVLPAKTHRFRVVDPEHRLESETFNRHNQDDRVRQDTTETRQRDCPDQSVTNNTRRT